MEREKWMDRLAGLTGKLNKKKRTDLVVLLGVCGVLLLALPELLPQNQQKSTQTMAQSQTDNSTYELQLEERLTSLLSQMEGVGRVQVMLTLETGETSVYAQTERTTASSNKTTEGQQTSQESFENDYVIVDGSDGEQALVNRTELPQIRGVVILCDGGEDASISRRVTEAASVLLGVSTNRICVNQLS